MFTFFFVHGFSSLLKWAFYGSLKLFEGSDLGSSFSELLEGCVDGGDYLGVERVCCQKKKRKGK